MQTIKKTAVLLAAIFVFSACSWTSKQDDTPTVSVELENPDGEKTVSEFEVETETSTDEQNPDGPKILQDTKTEISTGPDAKKLPMARSFQINAQQFEFVISPSPFRANLGDEISIQVKSSDVTHGFAIAEYGINVLLPPNEAKSFSFTADKAGIFKVTCSTYCGDGHPDMSTTFEVLE